MKSLAFPNMLNNTTTEVLSDHKATASNLKLLLLSGKNSLLGDPDFGTNLKQLFYEQGSGLLKDIIIDSLYETISMGMPQILLNRKNIQVTTDRQDIYVRIEALNLLDYQTDMYNISLTTYEVD